MRILLSCALLVLTASGIKAQYEVGAEAQKIASALLSGRQLDGSDAATLANSIVCLGLQTGHRFTEQQIDALLRTALGDSPYAQPIILTAKQATIMVFNEIAVNIARASQVAEKVCITSGGTFGDWQSVLTKVGQSVVQASLEQVLKEAGLGDLGGPLGNIVGGAAAGFFQNFGR